MKFSELRHLIALDAALATGGLDLPAFSRERRLTQDDAQELMAIIRRMDREVESRIVSGNERLFYQRGIQPVFRDTPMPEQRGMKRRIDRDEVRRLRAEGFSRIETAKKVGCTPDMVRKIEVGE